MANRNLTSKSEAAAFTFADLMISWKGSRFTGCFLIATAILLTGVYRSGPEWSLPVRMLLEVLTTTVFVFGLMNFGASPGAVTLRIIKALSHEVALRRRTSDRHFSSRLRRIADICGFFLTPVLRDKVWTPAFEDLFAEWARKRKRYKGAFARWTLFVGAIVRTVVILLDCVRVGSTSLTARWIKQVIGEFVPPKTDENSDR